jgi:hypothetical protein
VDTVTTAPAVEVEVEVMVIVFETVSVEPPVGVEA